MRRFVSILVGATLLFCAMGCDSFRSLTGNTKKTAQGSPYEVLVVCDGREWEGAVGEELRSLLNTPVEGINQVEPVFNIVRITAGDFKGLLPSYRNILKVLCSSSVTECGIFAGYDIVAAPQIVLTFQGPTQAAMYRCGSVQVFPRGKTFYFSTSAGISCAILR